ncbi:hypothetical protein A9Q99_01560 [Gammaproteobacteria bacterium 45_16_T64]|nr:hypothetical protein A9Q99_01560 [Gammaproteobacteria bacterium 45_16_T64]
MILFEAIIGTEKKMSRKIAILSAIIISFQINISHAITWEWVGADQTAVSTPLNNYSAGSGTPLTLTNINHLLDVNMLDNFYGMVPEGQEVSSNLLNSTFNTISIKDDLAEGEFATIKVTFLNEGAGYRNALGYFIYDTDTPPSSIAEVDHILVFPNSSKLGSGGGLIQGDQVDLQIELVGGKSIGFFVNSNGWNWSYGYQKSSFLYDQPFYTLPSLNPSVGLGQRYHVVLNDDQSASGDIGYFVYGFEDIRTNGGDRDYNDLIFNVEVSPVSAVEGVEEAIVIESVIDKVTTKAGTLAFEDNWPLAGDYDFNDAVLAYNITQTDNGESTNDYVKSIVLAYEINAIGATFHNGIALTIPGLTAGMIDSAVLEKTKDGVTTTITEETQVTTHITSAGSSVERSYPYPLIKDSELGNSSVTFTLSENLFEELSSFNSSALVYETNSCLYKTIPSGGCSGSTTAASLTLTITLVVDAFPVENIGSMPFDTYMFGSHKGDIYRFARGSGSSNDWFTPWSNFFSERDSANGPGPGNFLEIHLKQFIGSNAFEEDYSSDSHTNAKTVDAQNASNGGNRFISRQLTHLGVETGNLPWVLDLPEDWKHPKERVDINKAYPNFINWVEDNSTHQDWYESDVRTNKLYNN